MKKQPSKSLWDELVSENDGFVHYDRFRQGRIRADHWRYVVLTFKPTTAQFTFYTKFNLHPLGYIRLPALDTQEDVNTMGDNLLMLFNMSIPSEDE